MHALGWARRHRVLAAFAAGALLAFLVVVGAAYYVLSDQRRSARILAAALTEALDRRVGIERVSSLGTGRVVMRGVHLPRDGGWPADIAADRVEAAGPLLAAVRGDTAPVRLIVTRPTVDVPAGGAGTGLAALDAIRQGLESFLGGPILFDLTLTGGTARGAGEETEFDLTLRKGKGQAAGELLLRPERGAPLRLGVDAKLDGKAARVALSGRGGLASVAAWLPSIVAPALAGESLELAVEATAREREVAATGTARVGDVITAEGSAAFGADAVELRLPRAAVDLAFAAGLAGVAWRPTGRADLVDLTATWSRETEGPPTVRAGVRLTALGLPADVFGTEVRAERADGRMTLEPVAGGMTLSGEARATRLGAARLEAAPAAGRYRMTFGPAGAVARVELGDLDVRLEGAALRGTVAYDGPTHLVDARLGGEDVEAGDLVRRLVPGWLADEDRLRLSGLRVAVTGLAPRTLGVGEARFEVRGLRLAGRAGELSAGRTRARADLQSRRIRLTLESERAAGTVPAFTGSVPQIMGSAELARTTDGALAPERATVTARDRQGQEMLVADVSRAAAPGRYRLAARAPSLERLGSLWPAVTRQVNGSARLDVELAGPGWKGADGRLVLSVPAAEVAAHKVSVRDLEADVPIRRGTEMPGEPAWGTLAVGELIAYGVVARDVTTPARVFHDRLSLNDLTYALYSGEGKGWIELELQPAGLAVRGNLTGERVRIEEFISAYGVRGGTMTGLMNYKLAYEYRAGHLGANGRFEVPQGGTVNIELLNRLLAYAESDPTGIVRQALQNLRTFDYKSAAADVRSVGADVRVSVSLHGRERFLIFPPKVREINIRNMPLSFLARQFPAAN